MGLIMTIEVLIFIIALCLFCIYFVFEYQHAAIPPYQEPVGYEQDDGALTAAQLNQIKDTVEPTAINPKAAWPFPHGDKP
jgi:hypothetical protein